MSTNSISFLLSNIEFCSLGPNNAYKVVNTKLMLRRFYIDG